MGFPPGARERMVDVSRAPPADHHHEGRGETERRKLVARAGVVGAGTLVSRVLGLLREVALAAMFDREATDAWSVAFTIPNALRSLLGEGAVTSAVVPVLSAKLEQEGDGGARVLFSRVRGVSLLALTGITALGMLFARPLTRLFAAHAQPHEFERTVTLTRAVFPYIFFMGTAALGMAALHAKRRFAVAAFAPGLLNVALLVATFALPGVFGSRGIDTVLALAAGALVGGFLQVAVQWPALRAIGYAGAPTLVLDDDVRTILRRIGPLTLGFGVYYIDLVLSRRFLSGLGVGAQSYFWWAMRLCDFPQGIFSLALSTAALPSLSALAVTGDTREFAKTWAHGLSLSLFVAIPASALFVAVGKPIVVALFQRGEFDAVAARETARALAWQGAAVWTVAVVRQTVSALYALGDTSTPVAVSAIDLVAFIILAIELVGPLGHVGISVAVAGSSAVQMLLLLAGLKRRLGTVEAKALAPAAVRIAAASAMAGLAGWAAARLTLSAVAATAFVRAAPGLVGTLVFGTVFLVSARAMGSPELNEVFTAAQRRLGRPA